MSDLTTLSNLDASRGACRIVIETPRGCRNKFASDPGTLGQDGDPLDIMVLMDAPAHVGCLIEVRIIGIITAEQTENGKTEANDRLFGVAIHSYDHQDLDSIADVNTSLLGQAEEFFVSCNKQRGKKFKITGQGGPKKAVKFLKVGIRTYQDAHKEKSSSKKS